MIFPTSSNRLLRITELPVTINSRLKAVKVQQSVSVREGESEGDRE